MAKPKNTATVPDTEGTELGRAYLELKRQYDNLVSNNLAGVFRTTIAGRFLECNTSLAKMLGHASAEEVMRSPIKELYLNQDDRERFIAELTERKQLVNYEVLLKHKTGRPVYVLESVFLQEMEGRPATIEGTVIDITAFRSAELEQRALLNNYRQLLEHMRDGILIVQQGAVRYANPVAEVFAGGKALAGKKLVDLVVPEDHDRLLACLEGQEPAGEKGLVHIRFLGGTQGAVRELVVDTNATRHQGMPAVQVTLRDVGEQRTLQQERMRAKLAEEVNEVLRLEIRDHRRTQEALRQSKRFARSLIDSSLDTIIAVDQQGLVTEFNPAATVKFGYEAEEVVGTHSRQLYAEDGEYDRVQQELNKHGAFAGEVKNRTSDGRVFTSFLAASRLYDEDGQLLGSMGVSRDITQAKRDQETLRTSEERYRDLFENATDLIHSVDLDGRFQYVNTAWRKTLGYNDKEITDMTLSDVVIPEQRQAVHGWLADVRRSGTAGQWQGNFVAKDGRHLLMEGTSNVRIEDGKRTAVRSIFRDITSAHEAREQLQQLVAKERALFESSEHMFWTVDKRIALTGYNKGYSDMIERLYGVRPEINREPKRPKRKFASNDYHDFWQDKYAEVFTGKALRFETDLIDREGSRVCNEIFLSPIFDADGAVDEVFGIGHEITEQKEAEDTVREQAARLNAIFDSSANMMIWTLDRQFRITSFNEHFHASTKRAMQLELGLGDDFLGQMLKRVADKRSAVYGAHYKAALDGIPQQFEVELSNHAGRSLWVETFLNPITVDGEVTEISCLAHGITDKKEAQGKLLENLNEKEVLLKEVHHRVKNNLQIISSILNLQGGYVDEDPKMLELLRDSQDRIRSMSFIHESLYQTKNFSKVDLANYIDGLSRNLMMSYSLTGKVELEKDLERVDLGLDQAIPCGLILNELISNALKHAFPGGGKGRIDIRLREANDKVEIRLSDNGAGLPADFNEEHSTGLGLQLVHMLIGQLDGHIRREPPPNGRGVSYLITFDRP